MLSSLSTSLIHMANGRIKDGINVVRSQQKAHGYDYNFAFQEGISNLH